MTDFSELSTSSHGLDPEAEREALVQSVLEAANAPGIPWANSQAALDEHGDPVGEPGLLRIGLGPVGIGVGLNPRDTGFITYDRDPTAPSALVFGLTGMSRMKCETTAENSITLDEPERIQAIFENSRDLIALTQRRLARTAVVRTARHLEQTIHALTSGQGYQLEDESELQRQAAILQEALGEDEELRINDQVQALEDTLAELGIGLVEDTSFQITIPISASGGVGV